MAKHPEEKRLVVKFGTSTLVRPQGVPALSRLFAWIEEIAELFSKGHEILIVTSGAVGLGRTALGLREAPVELSLRQACAALGQTRLMDLYQQGFSRLGILVGQVLLTQEDFEHRERYLNLRSTLVTLLAQKVIPVINENDAVSTEELAYQGRDAKVFGDNDRLSALVASKLGADHLFLLTDVDGLYDGDPKDPKSRRIERLDPERDIDSYLRDSTSGWSRGGMGSKVQAARLAARAGSTVHILSGDEPRGLSRVLAGDALGTCVPASGQLSARKRWIAYATASKGRLVLDEGAVKALTQRGASLLAAGVLEIQGGFAKGEVVELADEEGRVLGRGMVAFDSKCAAAWIRGEVPEGVRNHHALIHRDHLVLGP